MFRTWGVRALPTEFQSPPSGSVFARCGPTLKMVREVSALGSSLPRSLLAHRPGWRPRRCRWCLLGLLLGALVSVRPQVTFPCSWLPWPGVLSWGPGCEILVQTTMDWVGFQSWASLCFSERRKVKLHESHITSRLFSTRWSQSSVQRSLREWRAEAGAPASHPQTPPLPFGLCGSPRASRDFKTGKNTLERAGFHLPFPEREVPWIWSPLCRPREHLQQHAVPQMQRTGPRASAAAGELQPPAHNPHLGARHLTLLTSSLPWAPQPCLGWVRRRWGQCRGFLLFRTTWPGFHLCKREENWEELLAWILTAFPAFCTRHLQEVLGGACHVRPSGKPAPAPAPAPAGVREFPSSEGSGAILWRPPLHPRGLKTYLANEEIISKGLALNLEGPCGVCHLLPSSHRLETRPGCRERQQTPGAWERPCEPAELALWLWTLAFLFPPFSPRRLTPSFEADQIPFPN